MITAVCSAIPVHLPRLPRLLAPAGSTDSATAIEKGSPFSPPCQNVSPGVDNSSSSNNTNNSSSSNSSNNTTTTTNSNNSKDTVIHSRPAGYISGSFGPAVKHLGSGNSGSVALYQHPWSGAALAIKKYQYPSHMSYTRRVQHLVNEASITLPIRHRHIVRTLAYVAEDDGSFYSIMEAHSSDLFAAIQQHPGGKMPPAVAGRIFAQLVAAVHHLHVDMHVAHRDIKLDNTLVDRGAAADGSADRSVLIDFGCAVKFTVPGEMSHGVCGSDPYIAPEVYLNGSRGGPGYDARKADIWSLAIVYLAMTSSFFPWESAKPTDRSFFLFLRNPLHVVRYWLNFASATNPDPKYAAEPGAVDLIVRMLSPDPCDRPLIEDIVATQWMQHYLRLAKIIQ
ncbi:kinase-like protein [Ramicandelaber brevisporus]|nr:kinase-like protein [Ramicandelaber brevisporus]